MAKFKAQPTTYKLFSQVLSFSNYRHLYHNIDYFTKNLQILQDQNLKIEERIGKTRMR